MVLGAGDGGSVAVVGVGVDRTARQGVVLEGPDVPCLHTERQAMTVVSRAILYFFVFGLMLYVVVLLVDRRRDKEMIETLLDELDKKRTTIYELRRTLDARRREQ
jgi:hypothetical protein